MSPPRYFQLADTCLHLAARLDNDDYPWYVSLLDSLSGWLRKRGYRKLKT